MICQYSSYTKRLLWGSLSLSPDTDHRQNTVIWEPNCVYITPTDDKVRVILIVKVKAKSERPTDLIIVLHNWPITSGSGVQKHRTHPGPNPKYRTIFIVWFGNPQLWSWHSPARLPSQLSSLTFWLECLIKLQIVLKTYIAKCAMSQNSQRTIVIVQKNFQILNSQEKNSSRYTALLLWLLIAVLVLLYIM